MKLISLNTWGGRVGEPLLNFFKENQDIDIFCLQEMYHQASAPIVEDLGDRLNLVSEIEALLPDHNMYFRPHVFNHFGLAVFIRKSILVTKEGDIFVFKTKEDGEQNFDVNHARNLQFVEIETEQGRKTILNFHGLWNNQGKSDTEERLEQSRRIKEFIDTTSGSKILCGDFNLLPDTESIKIIEDTGMRNLIKEYGITSTRTALYKKHANPILFADYAFVTEDIQVKEFKVLPDEVSDHAALYLEF